MAESPDETDYDYITNRPITEDAAIVIMSVTVVEGWLEKIIKLRMIELPKKVEGRLFEGYGPLSTFSGKLDMSFALGMLDPDLYSEIRGLKDIRNAFAHSPDLLYLRHPKMEPLVQKLHGWKKGCNVNKLFAERANHCVNQIIAGLKSRGYEMVKKDAEQSS